MNQNPSAIFQQEESFLEEETIDLRHYWRVLMRYKWGILGLGLLTSIITALVLINADDIYESSATLLIESNKPNITSIEEMYGIDSASREYFNTQFELLRNRSLAERVIRELDLKNHPDFIPEEGDFSPRAFISGLISPKQPTSPERAEQVLMSSILTSFSDKLTIAPVRNTDLANIIFESKDPQLAADVANRLAQTYIESTLEQRLAST